MYRSSRALWGLSCVRYRCGGWGGGDTGTLLEIPNCAKEQTILLCTNSQLRPYRCFPSSPQWQEIYHETICIPLDLPTCFPFLLFFIAERHFSIPNFYNLWIVVTIISSFQQEKKNRKWNTWLPWHYKGQIIAWVGNTSCRVLGSILIISCKSVTKEWKHRNDSCTLIFRLHYHVNSASWGEGWLGQRALAGEVTATSQLAREAR